MATCDCPADYKAIGATKYDRANTLYSLWARAAYMQEPAPNSHGVLELNAADTVRNQTVIVD